MTTNYDNKLRQMKQTVEVFVPQQICQGWGFFVDIEEGYGTTISPTKTVSNPNFKPNHNHNHNHNHNPKPKPIIIPTSMHIPAYVPRETRYITVKPDRPPSLTLEDMV